MDIDQKQYREALGQFVTGITVITALDQNHLPLGFTANSFNSVSLDPPLVLWSLAKSASTYRDFMAAERFGIHILAEDQIELSNRFASTSDNRFQNLEYELKDGIPLLGDYLARFQCSLEHIYAGGDHSIFVARVERFDHNADKQALVYHRGSYAGLKD
jgi:flavin reductase (DIM6/NTAB) family NADH-FMN oxidoreductase RutF